MKRLNKKIPKKDKTFSNYACYAFVCAQLFGFTFIYHSGTFKNFDFDFGLSGALEQQYFFSPVAPNRKGLPSLQELTAIPANYSCPEGTTIFENVVLPTEITHQGRKIPQVVHITAKTRCVTNGLRQHISQWVLPNHSLYFHDDEATFKLLDYAIRDAQGHELVKGLSKSLLCISSGATMSDFWRLVVLYHYGGIYTDLDNSLGRDYKTDLITPETDAFFLVEYIGVPSQYYMASSKHHPLLLHVLNHCWKSLYHRGNNVMTNNPAGNTGPKAVKIGFIMFMGALGTKTDGYLPAGIYHGGVGPHLHSRLVWLNETETTGGNNSDEYPRASDLVNRSVTIVGKNGRDSNLIVNRMGLNTHEKNKNYKTMNMTHFHNARAPREQQISCAQHVARMKDLTSNETSFYFQKSKLVDLLPRYKFRDQGRHFFDVNTNEMLIPWSKERMESFDQEDCAKYAAGHK